MSRGTVITTRCPARNIIIPCLCDTAVDITIFDSYIRALFAINSSATSIAIVAGIARCTSNTIGVTACVSAFSAFSANCRTQIKDAISDNRACAVVTVNCPAETITTAGTISSIWIGNEIGVVRIWKLAIYAIYAIYTTGIATIKFAIFYRRITCSKAGNSTAGTFFADSTAIFENAVFNCRTTEQGTPNTASVSFA